MQNDFLGWFVLTRYVVETYHRLTWVYSIPNCPGSNLFGINVGLAGLIDICTQGCIVCMEWLFFQGEYV
mgnify:FL=1|jgi:hypothetical protein